jgi:hypothetical protein
MLALGVPMFVRIQIPLSKKIPLVGVFSLGIFVIIAAVLSKSSSFADVFDDAWVYWYVRESSTAIIVANLPFVWLLYRRMFGIKTTSASASRTKSGHNVISLRSRTEQRVTIRAPRPRKGSDDSEMAFGLGKSELSQASTVTTTVTTGEDVRRERSFDDKVANDPSTTKHLGLFHGHRSRERVMFRTVLTQQYCTTRSLQALSCRGGLGCFQLAVQISISLVTLVSRLLQHRELMR